MGMPYGKFGPLHRSFNHTWMLDVCERQVQFQISRQPAVCSNTELGKLHVRPGLSYGIC